MRTTEHWEEPTVYLSALLCTLNNNRSTRKVGEWWLSLPYKRGPEIRQGVERWDEEEEEEEENTYMDAHTALLRFCQDKVWWSFTRGVQNNCFAPNLNDICVTQYIMWMWSCTLWAGGCVCVGGWGGGLLGVTVFTGRLCDVWSRSMLCVKTVLAGRDELYCADTVQAASKQTLFTGRGWAVL